MMPSGANHLIYILAIYLVHMATFLLAVFPASRLRFHPAISPASFLKFYLVCSSGLLFGIVHG